MSGGEPTKGDELAPEAARLLGKKVGNFLISEILGQGGMGTVFVAVHPTLGKRVAVKFLSRALATLPEMAIRFLAEARTAAGLRHPNIVDIFDFGEIDDRPFYVMELLEGLDLGTVMSRRGRFPVEEVAEYVTQIGAALEVAHERGVVHRDLKPPNVFVLSGAKPHLKLMDFGIARVLDNRTTKTQSGQILGTPSHMAPEQVLGNLREIGPQTDLYSFGVILYEMLTGVPLFQHESPAMVMFMHLRDRFVPIRDLAPDVPLGVARIVEKCLSKAAADRPASARELTNEFLAACQAAGSDGPIAPSEVPPETIDMVGQLPKKSAPRSRVVAPADPDPKPATPVVARPRPVAGLAAAATLISGPNPKVHHAIEPKPASPADPPAAPLPRPPRKMAPESAIFDARDGELTESEQAALGRVLIRMQGKGDFPAFMKNVADVSRKADRTGAASASQLGDAILKDYALTAKLLRVVNSSYYERFGKKITKVSRAVVVLGFEQVRAVALSIAIHKNPAKKAHADELAELSFNSLVSGEIARSVAAAVGLRDGEEAMVCAMFRNLGLHLVVYYLPEDYDKIVKLVDTLGLGYDAAAEKVLGISFRKLGTGMVQKWRLSPRISASMLGANRDAKPRHDEDKLRLISAFSNELSETVSSTPADEIAGAVDAMLARYKKALHLPAAQVPQIFAAVQTSFKTKYSTLLGVDPERSQFFRNAKHLKPATAAHEQGHDPPQEALQPRPPERSAEVHAEELDRCLEDIARARTESRDPAEILEMALRTFATCFGFRRALVLVAGRDRSTLSVLAAWGEDAAMLKDDLVLPLAPSLSADLFSRAFHTGKEVVVLDAFDEKNTARIARTYYEMVGSAVFVLYPCGRKGATKLLFADADSVEAVPRPDKIAYVQKLRDLIGSDLSPAPAPVNKDIRLFVPKRIDK